MRVLFQSRKTLFSVPGGDTVQLEKTKEFLERLGVHVDISLDLEPETRGYDVVHVFNLMRGQETFLQVRNAKRAGRPVALSTIYGLYSEFDQKARGGVAGIVARTLGPFEFERAKVAARALLNGEVHAGVWQVLLRGYYRTLRSIVRQVDVFLPNSESEMERVRQDFELQDAVHVVVPNAVDVGVFAGASGQHGGITEREGVICVARIEGRKSQLELVRAVRDLPFTLRLVGKAAPNHRRYLEAVQAEAGPNTQLVGPVPHSELAAYYRSARVHALVSWMETPGLASLEAAAMGCNLVVTRKGDTHDYFGDDAFYCEPDDVISIREALLSAYETPVPEALGRRVRDLYTWERAAAKTLEGYRVAAGRSPAEHP